MKKMDMTGFTLMIIIGIASGIMGLIIDLGVRGFLLQSLRREGDSWRWLLNLDLLARDLDAITDWPARFDEAPPYQGPVLWVGGARSPYAARTGGSWLGRTTAS